MKKTKIPSKDTLNLVVKEKTLASPSRLIPIILLFIVCLAIFTRFAVLLPLEKVREAEAELFDIQRNLQMIKDAYADYDEVEAEYNRYTYENYDKTLFDRLDVLALLEREIFPACTVQNINISGQTISMTVTGPTLEEASDILSSLRSDTMVDSVYMSSYTDNSENALSSETTTIALTITLKDATVYQKELEQQAAAKEEAAEENSENAEAQTNDDGAENGGDE